MCCCNKIPPTRCLINNWNSLLTVWKLRRARSRCRWSHCLVRAHTWLQKWSMLLCPHVVQGLGSIFPKGTCPICKGGALRLNHLPKASPLGTAASDIWFQCMHFGGHFICQLGITRTIPEKNSLEEERNTLAPSLRGLGMWSADSTAVGLR